MPLRMYLAFFLPSVGYGKALDTGSTLATILLPEPQVPLPSALPGTLAWSKAETELQSPPCDPAGLAISFSAQADTASDLYRLSYTQENAGESLNAMETMDTLRELGEGGYFVEMRLGWLLYLCGCNSESAAYYRRAAEREGWALLMMGKKEETRKEFEGILRVSPDHLSAAQGLGALD